jgi:hypothetical protein
MSPAHVAASPHLAARAGGPRRCLAYILKCRWASSSVENAHQCLRLPHHAVTLPSEEERGTASGHINVLLPKIAHNTYSTYRVGVEYREDVRLWRVAKVRPPLHPHCRQGHPARQ